MMTFRHYKGTSGMKSAAFWIVCQWGTEPLIAFKAPLAVASVGLTQKAQECRDAHMIKYLVDISSFHIL